MATINIHEAKTHFSRLLGRVESGEEIVIAKAGKPVARLVPLINGLGERKPGTARGQIVLKKGLHKSLTGSRRRKFDK